MLSYRHAFHAGNHGDILKHIILVEIISYLHQKDKAFWVIDTHAGAGSYSLTSKRAEKNKEFESGITRLWKKDDHPTELTPYLQLVESINPKHQLSIYPGSPWLAKNLIRPQDKLHLFELHPDDYPRLKKRLGGHSNINVSKTDGFKALKSLLPPQPRRGLIHIDPSYETKDDYLKVISSVQEGLKRFSNGTYMIWYPIINNHLAQKLPEKLKKIGADKWANYSLRISADQEGYGMTGSGVFVINPPWQLTEKMKIILPYLAKTLSDHIPSDESEAQFNIETN